MPALAYSGVKAVTGDPATPSITPTNPPPSQRTGELRPGGPVNTQATKPTPVATAHVSGYS